MAKGVEGRVVTAPPAEPPTELFSCANQLHEVVEAFRWMRALLAKRRQRRTSQSRRQARATMMTMCFRRRGTATFHPLRRRHQGADDGRRAGGQRACRGACQRLVARTGAPAARVAAGGPALRDLPGEWTRLLPADAPPTSVERWERVLTQADAAAWPEGKNRTADVMAVIRLLDRGAEAAEEAGETLLADCNGRYGGGRCGRGRLRHSRLP